MQNQKVIILKEIMTIAAILGIIALIAVPSLIQHIDEAKAVEEQKSMHIVKEAAKRYIMEQGVPQTDMDTEACQVVLVVNHNYLDSWPMKQDGQTEMECKIGSDGTITVKGTGRTLIGK